MKPLTWWGCTVNHIAAIARLVSGMTDSKCKFSDGNVHLASLGSILSSAIDLLRYVSLPSMPLGLPQTVFRVLFSVLPSGKGTFTIYERRMSCWSIFGAAQLLVRSGRIFLWFNPAAGKDGWRRKPSECGRSIEAWVRWSATYEYIHLVIVHFSQFVFSVIRYILPGGGAPIVLDTENRNGYNQRWCCVNDVCRFEAGLSLYLHIIVWW